MFSLIRITTEHQGEAFLETLFPRATEKNVIFQKDLDGQNLLEFDATIFRRQFIEGTLMLQLAVHPNDYGCIVMDLSARVEDPKK